MRNLLTRSNRPQVLGENLRTAITRLAGWAMTGLPPGNNAWDRFSLASDE